ncbi:MAG TPA: tetratricopeptide repeat protein [Acetobacteraceae bacterium]|nr:tetratricopeptide repeat protein [Acetobacteraceae bacterium]
MAVADTLLLAIAHHRAGRHSAAEALYHGVIAAEPGNGQALYLHGLLLLETGRAGEAVTHLRRAVEVGRGDVITLVNLGRALLADGRPDETLRVADQVLSVSPDHAEAAFLRGTALNALGDADRAVEALQVAIAREPRNAAAWLNLGNAYADLDQLEAAEQHCRKAVNLAPDLTEAHASLGFILTSLGRLDEAIAACDAAIALRPDFAQAHWNEAVAALLAGDFALGFSKYEWRKRHDRYRHDFIDLPGPQWDGSDPAGRTILVHAEQGFGDTIQFARYLPRIGRHVVLCCDRPLIPLLGQLRGVDVVAKDAAIGAYDCWIDQMSLPRVFGTRLETIPAAEGYLRAEPWRGALPDGIKVGLAWAGNPAHSNDRRRSMPASAIQPILAVPGISVISLQVGVRAGELSLPSPPLVDFAATASLIAALDLVITVDTAVAHVAGALGKPAWVLLPYAPDWRWLLGRSDSPWYSSLRLFRQPVPGDWDAVADEVAGELACLAGTRLPMR